MCSLLYSSLALQPVMSTSLPSRERGIFQLIRGETETKALQPAALKIALPWLQQIEAFISRLKLTNSNSLWQKVNNRGRIPLLHPEQFLIHRYQGCVWTHDVSHVAYMSTDYSRHFCGKRFPQNVSNSPPKFAPTTFCKAGWATVDKCLTNAHIVPPFSLIFAQHMYCWKWFFGITQG